MEATKLLDEDKLTSNEFLCRVIFHNTKLEADIGKFDVGKNDDDVIQIELEALDVEMDGQEERFREQVFRAVYTDVEKCFDIKTMTKTEFVE